jgi:bifunctional DNA-binding transcriptional regulator/antitoxin component of YhaV-PrlF toxin-antitoxin module
MSKKSIKIVSYGTNKLQGGNRVKLPDPLVETLSIRKGEKIHLLLDTERAEIILRKVKNGEASSDSEGKQ